jgi:hypothetical protein
MRVAWLFVLATACGGNDALPDGGGGKPIDAPSGAMTPAQACVQKTNFYRMTVPAPGTGAARPALAESSALDTYATTGAMYDFSNSPHAHFMATNGGGIAFAENECPQQLGWTLMGDVNSTVEACVTAFYNGGPGEGHYENMMNTGYTKVGCGVFMMGNGITITQDFGN